uniref:Uncharacterized protein n=1 Tax=Anguilla anguilla TaxID=7936 RepID=A0A0E9T9E7_ANGAN
MITCFLWHHKVLSHYILFAFVVKSAFFNVC